MLYFSFCIKFCIVITVFAVRKVILDTSERGVFKDPLTVVSFLESINTLRSFSRKSSSITKKKKKKGREPEQKQSWECNFKLKAISHEIDSMILQAEIQENSLYIK